jgi:hypothetical protein
MASSIFVTPLGQAVAVSSLVVTESSGAVPPIETHTPFANGIDCYSHSDTAFRGPAINLYKSRGTQAAPTAIQSGDTLGYMEWGGYDSAAYVAASSSIIVTAGENWTSSAHGTTTTFRNTKTGSSGAGIALTFSGALNNVGVGVSAATAALQLRAGTTAASSAPLKFTSGPLMTSGEAGACEFLTDDFYATITTGTARKGIVLNDGSNLTSGKIPIASTNGRLIDGQTPLAGTKVYWVSDTSGGAVNRKLTFIAGILTAET